MRHLSCAVHTVSLLTVDISRHFSRIDRSATVLALGVSANIRTTLSVLMHGIPTAATQLEIHPVSSRCSVSSTVLYPYILLEKAKARHFCAPSRVCIYRRNVSLAERISNCVAAVCKGGLT